MSLFDSPPIVSCYIQYNMGQDSNNKLYYSPFDLQSLATSSNLGQDSNYYSAFDLEYKEYQPALLIGPEVSWHTQ